MGNVKLIIEIPEWYYEETKEFKHPTLIDKAIMNGTPLDDVKAEIEEHVLINQNLNTDRARALCWCLDVIDKHIGKAESEAKPE